MAEDSDSGKRKADSDVEMEDSDESSKQKKQKTESEPASLFVGNLPFTATVESMKDTFAQFGEVVDARIAMDSSTGRPRGFGYVDFASEEARDKAMASDYVEIEGRQLRMDVATTKSNKREQGGASSSDPTNPPSKTLFMGNMSFHSTEDSIREAFSECGDVVSVRIVTDRETGRPKGFGYIEFETVEAATSAIAWNGTDLDGRNIRLDYSTPRTNDGGGRGGGRGGFRGGRGGGGRGGGFRGGRGGGRGGGGRFNSNY
ncbi:nuclear localization sequence binding protein [Coemansia sp. RSA 551]|nr:nuclear localization sequence binding protein [Coemansia sp. RSA 551]